MEFIKFITLLTLILKTTLIRDPKIENLEQDSNKL